MTENFNSFKYDSKFVMKQYFLYPLPYNTNMTDLLHFQEASYDGRGGSQKGLKYIVGAI